MKKETKISSDCLFRTLSSIKTELDNFKDLSIVPVDSALYAFLFAGSFSVAAALNHLYELREE